MSILFKLPIGDWSGDGHGKCDYFIVKSEKSFEEVKEAHEKIEEVTGVNIHGFCNDYEESYIDEDLVDDLKDLGFKEVDLSPDDYIEPETMMLIWIFLLNLVDPELKLEPLYNSLPVLTTSDYVGYGLF